ncbi:MAG: DMT family transporter [Gammaproteobacteria bacterium]|nr:DMT family transporter [Gammaproteobacteria bacterium]
MKGAPKPSDETAGMLLGFLGVAAFSLTLPVTRMVVEHFSPLFVGVGRAFVAGLAALVYVICTRESVPPRRYFVPLLVVSGGIVFGFPLLSAWAMVYVPASHGAVMLGILPLATAIACAVLARERPSLKFWAAGGVGTAAVLSFALLRSDGRVHPADLALLGAVAAAAVGYAEGARLSRTLGGWRVICWALILSLPLLALPTAWEIARLDFSVPASTWLGFLYLSLVSQFLGFFFWYRGLSLGGIARVSQVQLLQIFLTLFASAWLLNESVDATTIFFAVFVVGTVAVSRRMPVHRAA